MPNRHRAVPALLLLLALVAAARAEVRFVVTADPALAPAYTGRVYVMLSKNDRTEPRFGPRWFSSDPFFATDVKDWDPTQPLTITAENSIGYPMPLSALPSGRYAVQAVLRLNRDEPAIGLGEGNLYSPAFRGEVDAANAEIALHVDTRMKALPLLRNERIRQVELRSDRLSDFHGRDVVMKATVVLPKDYDADPARRWPTIYVIGGFGSDHRIAPAAFAAMQREGVLDTHVRVILDPRCYGGHHVFADSANNGPRGRALLEELIPHLEREFRVDPRPGARFLTGHSSGGWATLWLQVEYPEAFGGCWSTAPDPVDFHAFQLVDIHAPDANMYRAPDGTPIAVAQRDGRPFAQMKDFVAMERVIGEGGQIRSFEWAFSPRGADGLPAPLFDRVSGAIDPRVAEAWRAYDIREKLEREWPEIGPRLAGKIHVFVGDQDTFFLHPAVARLKVALEQLGADAVVEIHPGKDHGTLLSGDLQGRIQREILAAYAALGAP